MRNTTHFPVPGGMSRSGMSGVSTLDSRISQYLLEEVLTSWNEKMGGSTMKIRGPKFAGPYPH